MRHQGGRSKSPDCDCLCDPEYAKLKPHKCSSCVSQFFREAGHPWAPWQLAQGGDSLFSWPAAASCLKLGGREFWGSSVSLPETPLRPFTQEPLRELAGLEEARAQTA